MVSKDYPTRNEDREVGVDDVIGAWVVVAGAAGGALFGWPAVVGAAAVALALTVWEAVCADS